MEQGVTRRRRLREYKWPWPDKLLFDCKWNEFGQRSLRREEDGPIL